MNPRYKAGRAKRTLRLRQNKACTPQGRGEPDQRKTNNSGGVVALDALEERDPEALGAKAARAIERPLALNVAVDFLAGEAAEKHRRRVDVHHADACLGRNDRTGGMEARARTAGGGELGARS